MIITNKINMDLAFCAAESRGDLQTLQVYVVQDDKYSRDLEITLLSGGEARAVPEGAAVAVSYSAGWDSCLVCRRECAHCGPGAPGAHLPGAGIHARPHQHRRGGALHF